MPLRYRQEVFNVLLAQLLQERGIVTAPESITCATDETSRQMPDVIVRFRGLRVAIEGEVSDAANSSFAATSSALHRVTTGLAHIGVGVVYPASLRSVSFSDLKDKLANTNLEIAVVTEAGSLEPAEGDIDYLEKALSHAFDQLVQEDVVRKAVGLLSGAIDGFSAALAGKSGTRKRLARKLGISEVIAKKRKQG